MLRIFTCKAERNLKTGWSIPVRIGITTEQGGRHG